MRFIHGAEVATYFGVSHVFCDCDDTQWDIKHLTAGVNVMLVQQVLQNRNSQNPTVQTDAIGNRFAGVSFSVAIDQELKIYGVDLTPEEIRDLFAQYEEMVPAILESEETIIEPMPGLMDVLTRLTRENIGISSVSSSNMRRMIACTTKAGLLRLIPLENLFSAESSLPVPRPKPAPDICIFAAQRVGVDPEDCIAVEDSPSGVKAFVAAGIHTIGYLGAYPASEYEDRAIELRKVGAQLVIPHYDQFPLVHRIDPGI